MINKIPNKIYCESDGLGNIVKTHNIKWPDNEAENIEYIRSDVFIENTCVWLRNNSHNYAENALGKEYLVNDFKNYIKGLNVL